MDGEVNDMNATDRALERMIEENDGLVLFVSAVASACCRLDRLPPEMRTSGFVAEAIAQYLDLARSAASPPLSASASGELNASARLLVLSLAAQRSALSNPGKTVQ